MENISDKDKIEYSIDDNDIMTVKFESGEIMEITKEEYLAIANMIYNLELEK